MSIKMARIPLLLTCALLSFACAYIVLPEELDEIGASGSESRGWSAIVTNVGESGSGDVHIDITIRNETGDWSAMQAAAGKPAVLTSSDGKTTTCETVFVGTGGHRLAPGFQMRGYTTGNKAKPETQLLYVECKGVGAVSGAKLSIDYVSFAGPLNYYHQDENKTEGTLELNLDQVVTDLAYPVALPVDGLIYKPGDNFIALSENVITLLGAQRTDAGLQLNWQNYNPTEFALNIHIGIPPAIGADGIIYGVFEIMDIVSVPITPAGGKMEWTTEVAVPQDVGGFYILLSVESKQPRLYVNYAVDISDQ
ncbi:MAG: hypothetical protein JXA78_00785 [Anaerolineales bacterium]|nr:hypothetical protein [Anaerolineales bacterium]